MGSEMCIRDSSHSGWSGGLVLHCSPRSAKPRLGDESAEDLGGTIPSGDAHCSNRVWAAGIVRSSFGPATQLDLFFHHFVGSLRESLENQLVEQWGYFDGSGSP